jgi:hypothetical protein
MSEGQEQKVQVHELDVIPQLLQRNASQGFNLTITA